MFAVEIEDFKAEYDNKLANFMSSNEVADKIKTLEKEVDDGVKKLFTNLMSHIDKADKITEAIKVEKNYVVGVRPGIDKHDVVVKEQILKPLKLSENIDIVDVHDPNVKNALDFKGKRLSSVSKGINPFDVVVMIQLEDHIKMFNELKQNYENHKQHVKDFTTEVYDKLEVYEKLEERSKRSVDDVGEINEKVIQFEQYYNSFTDSVNEQLREIAQGVIAYQNEVKELVRKIQEDFHTSQDNVRDKIKSNGELLEGIDDKLDKVNKLEEKINKFEEDVNKTFENIDNRFNGLGGYDD
ncbi:hypothetical protein J6590_107248 [Homalodisca vitripennis]|nr:hypothetical protein J6590_107248 [Homalodisca vitripennis]